MPCLEAEVVCSDPEIHRARVETRTADVTGLELPSWQAVVDRDYESWDSPQLIVLDTAVLSVEQSVARLVQAIEVPVRWPSLD